MRDNRKMPKATEILNRWYKILTDDYGKDLDDNWNDKPNATFICFACNMDAGTERCHILPRCEGGSDEVDNLHLLCKECHLESETLSGDVYWQWLQSKNYSNSGSFLRVWNKTKIIQSLYEQKKFDLIPADILSGINKFINKMQTKTLTVITMMLLMPSCATYQQSDDDGFVFDSDKPGWIDGQSYLLDISNGLDSLVEDPMLAPQTVAMYNKYLDYRRYFDVADTLPPTGTLRPTEVTATADDAAFAALITPYPPAKRKLLIMVRNAGIDVFSSKSPADTLPQLSGDFIYFIKY